MGWCLLAQQDPRAVLKAVAGAYKDAQSYDIEAEVTSGQEHETIEIAYSAPDLLRVENKSRGETTVFHEQGMSEYSARANVFAAVSNTDQRRIAAIVQAGYAWYPLIESRMSRARFLREEPVDMSGASVPCAVIEASYAHGVRRTYWVDPARDAVLREVDSSPGKQDRIIAVRKLIWNQPLPPALFAFNPPSAYTNHGPIGVVSARICQRPDYTPEARFVHLSGSIYVTYILDEQGRPTQVQAANSLGLGLDENAIACVEGSRLQPITREGAPIRVPSGTLMSFDDLGDSDWHLGRVAFAPEDGVTSPSFKKVGYPQRAGDLRSFHVELHLTIDAQGVPRDIQPAAGSDPKAAKEAQKIVAGWRFTPGERNGKPVGVAAVFDLVHRRATMVRIRP